MELTNRRFLVTGGAGFIASHLTERLVDEDNEVVVLDDLSNGTESAVPSEAKLIEGDLTTETRLPRRSPPVWTGCFTWSHERRSMNWNRDGSSRRMPRDDVQRTSSDE